MSDQPDHRVAWKLIDPGENGRGSIRDAISRVLCADAGKPVCPWLDHQGVACTRCERRSAELLAAVEGCAVLCLWSSSGPEPRRPAGWREGDTFAAPSAAGGREIQGEASFLLSRLDEFFQDNVDEDCITEALNDWLGHVAPSISRLKGLLASPSQGSDTGKAGRDPKGSGSRPSDQAAAHPVPAGFDPSRGWQPIATAPRNGKEVYLWAEAWEGSWGVQIARFEYGQWHTEEGTVDDNEPDFDPDAEIGEDFDPDELKNLGPTHWTPFDRPSSPPAAPCDRSPQGRDEGSARESAVPEGQAPSSPTAPQGADLAELSAAEAMRAACLRIIEDPNAGLVPPDGGDPITSEMFANVAAEIRALVPTTSAPPAPAVDQKAVDAVAEAWASIDGKDDHYRRERDEGIGLTDPACTGHYEGYLAEAEELITRIRTRGFDVLAHPGSVAPTSGDQAPWSCDMAAAPADEEVEVGAGRMTFLAKLVPNGSLTMGGKPCDQWQATREGEHPPCWSDGCCWASNEDEDASLLPDRWRRVAPPPASRTEGERP